MLSPLQRQVAEIIAGLEEAEGFALAGGAALIARGNVQRQTRDLDFFGLTGSAVDRLVPAVDRALRAAGLATLPPPRGCSRPSRVGRLPRSAKMLAGFGRLRREEFDLDDARYAQLTRDVDRWRARAIELARL